jgi:hypothetical protein
MARGGILGGAIPDPDFGKPHRHTRAKVMLLMQDVDDEQRERVILMLLDKHPESVLDAVIKVLEPEE